MVSQKKKEPKVKRNQKREERKKMKRRD